MQPPFSVFFLFDFDLRPLTSPTKKKKRKTQQNKKQP